MGVDNFYYRKFKKVVDEQLTEGPKKALCLGYPDCLVDYNTLVELHGNKFANKIPQDPLPDEIRAWHKKASLPKIFDMLWILREQGFEPTIFDGVNHRGFEVIVDLNEPLAEEHKQQYDIVIDTGTLEHCFNVGTAFKNVCESLKQGGVFMSAAPISKLNHGYWNFCTLAHQDGFEWNGFEILDRSYWVKNKELDVNTITPKSLPNRAITVVVAKRNEIKEWRWPIQGKYLR